MLFVWILAMLFMGVRHVSAKGLPKMPRKEPKPPPEPTKTGQLTELRSQFEEEIQLLNSLGLTDMERNAAVMHARQKYTHKIKEVLD